MFLIKVSVMEEEFYFGRKHKDEPIAEKVVVGMGVGVKGGMCVRQFAPVTGITDRVVVPAAEAR